MFRPIALRDQTSHVERFLKIANEKSTIAVVDDDPRVLESLQNLMESAGYNVLIFQSASVLLNTVEMSRIDCLISDIGMPIIDGLELRQLVNSARPNLPVFLITGRDEISKKQSGTGRGTHRFFQKPFNGADLLAAVAEALEDYD
jgi:FixJ family two-component response regulator